MILMAVNELCKGLSGQAHRPDTEAIVVSGLFEECAKGIEAVAAGGTEQLHNVSVYPLYWSLKVWLNCHSHPKCEARIRSLATALEFCLEHDMEAAKALCATTAGIAASIGEPASATAQSLVHLPANNRAPTETLAGFRAACVVFGRDEGGSNFVFNQFLVNQLVGRWSSVVRAKGLYATFALSSDSLMAEELCISDR